MQVFTKTSWDPCTSCWCRKYCKKLFQLSRNSWHQESANPGEVMTAGIFLFANQNTITGLQYHDFLMKFKHTNMPNILQKVCVNIFIFIYFSWVYFELRI